MATSASESSSATTEFRNWLEIPDELMRIIFRRLEAAEILNSAMKVCTSWQRICKDPAMWKVIVMHKSFDNWDKNYDHNTVIKQAVDLSCGELIDISIKGFCTDDLLHHIVLCSSKLNRVCLWNCYHMTGSGLSRAVKGAPQLENLRLFNTPINAKDIEAIGRNCPQLKSFMMAKRFTNGSGGLFLKCDDHALAIANNMPELRHLVLIDGEMTNDGLEAILIGCPHLLSLDVTMSQILVLNGNLGKLCMERIKDFKHHLI